MLLIFPTPFKPRSLQTFVIFIFSLSTSYMKTLHSLHATQERDVMCHVHVEVQQVIEFPSQIIAPCHDYLDRSSAPLVHTSWSCSFVGACVTEETDSTFILFLIQKNLKNSIADIWLQLDPEQSAWDKHCG